MDRNSINGTPFIAGRWPLEHKLRTVVFIHGAAGSGMFWKEQVEGLSDCCNTVAPDLPGHGENTLRPGFSAVDDYADAVEEFILSLEIREPVICGLSMGGLIVQKLLLDGKIRYSAGIIVNSGARLRVMPAIFELIRNNYSGFIASLPVMGAAALSDKSKFAGIIADAEMCTPETAAGDFTACGGFDVAERLDRINVPLLVLTADEDKLAPAKLGQFIHYNIPGSQYLNVIGAGHFSPVEKPDVVNESIRRFLGNL